jgi:tetratricopeptide (TPR) repeat protein
MYNEGKIIEALEHQELVITQTLLCDDIYSIYHLHKARAYSLRNLDSKKAHELLDRAIAIHKELGFDVEEDWTYHNIRASVHNARGEYDHSLHCYQKAIQSQESQKLQTSLRYLPINMSYVYGELEDGENALEWAKMAMTTPQFLTAEPIFMTATLTRLARSFLLLGDIEQAEKYLEESETISLKVGSDSAIAEIQIVTGHIENAKGNLETAMFHFERGLEIAEQINHQNRINSCLIALVKTVIAMLESDQSNSLLNTSGPWMKLLQSEMSNKDLPGIQGILLLLKTELRLKQGRIDEANNLLKEIRSIAKDPGLDFLGRKAFEMQSKIALEFGR